MRRVPCSSGASNGGLCCPPEPGTAQSRRIAPNQLYARVLHLGNASFYSAQQARQHMLLAGVMERSCTKHLEGIAQSRRIVPNQLYARVLPVSRACRPGCLRFPAACLIRAKTTEN
jgi:hypothetical protein